MGCRFWSGKNMLLKLVYRCIVLALAFPCLLGSGGCVSMRYTTNINPPTDISKILKGYKFDIAKVQYSREGSEYAGSAPLNTRPKGLSDAAAVVSVWNDEKWRNELMKTAMNRYPAIFSSGPNTYPLAVSIHMKAKTLLPASITLEVVTLTLFGGFLPLPMHEVCDIRVAPALMLDDEATRVPLSLVDFRRRDTGWGSVFTPLALIPVPGFADKRETMIIRLDPNAANTPVKGMELSLEGCADAIVLSLQASGQDIKEALTRRSLNSGGLVP